MRLVQEVAPQTRTYDIWWVDDRSGNHPCQFGSDEETCRQYQKRHGGELQMTRVWTTTMQITYAMEGDE